jgi:hypothetical protein
MPPVTILSGGSRGLALVEHMLALGLPGLLICTPIEFLGGDDNATERNP